MTIQNPKSEKDKFKDDFRRRLKNFVVELVRFVDSLPNDRSCRIMADQLMRSGTSVGANYFEARAASSKNDFTNFFTYSLKSANESKFWLETLIDTKKCNVPEADRLLREVSEIGNVLASSILTLKGKR